MRTDVNACDCTRGCTDTGRESALKVDSGKKILYRTELLILYVLRTLFIYFVVVIHLEGEPCV